MNPNVLILEDQPDGIKLLTQVTQASFVNACITVANDLASVRQLAGLQFDYALIDLRLPDGLSIEWLAQYKFENPKTVAIVTSLYDDDDLVFAALRAGADGYLLKGDGVENLTDALVKVLQGEPPISPAIARKLMAQFRRSAVLPEAVAQPAIEEQASERLTAREEDVLALIGSGLMIKQVAGRLGISYHTVNDNIKAIYRKLGIHTRAEAAAEASRRGLVG